MKKILVVGFDGHYISAQRLFNEMGFNPIFCSNRIDAEKYLPFVEALVIDQNVPYSEENIFAPGLVPSPIGYILFKSSGLTYSDEEIGNIQSYYLMLKARSLGKSAVMIAKRRNEIGVGTVEEMFDEKSFYAYMEISKNFLCEDYIDLLNRVEKNSTQEDYFHLFLYAYKYGVKINWRPYNNISSEVLSFNMFQSVKEELKKQLN